MADPSAITPLTFAPIYKEKVWGGRSLEQLGRRLPGDATTPVGESWELADLEQTATTGGGDARSVIANGPLQGQTLQAAIDTWGDRLMGRLSVNAAGAFPLLVKFLDASENLSVQVHPSPEYAAAHDDAHLKSEAWYIVDAKPGACLYKGIREGVTPAAFRAAIESNDATSVEAMMIRVPARRGDCHYLPSGTCHALGAGILVAEVQTASDTTFRVFDWGRTDRQLHVEQAMACIDFHPPDVARCEKRSHIAGVFTAVSRLVTCEHFQIEKVRMSEAYEQEIPYDQPTIWMVLEGAGRIITSDAGETPFAAGQTWLLPAAMNQPRIHLDADTTWLEVTFPQVIPIQIA